MLKIKINQIINVILFQNSYLRIIKRFIKKFTKKFIKKFIEK